jgi:hypothetical protein
MLVSNLLFTDEDCTMAGGYVLFAPYGAGLQKRPYDGRYHELSCMYVKYSVL